MCYLPFTIRVIFKQQRGKDVIQKAMGLLLLSSCLLAENDNKNSIWLTTDKMIEGVYKSDVHIEWKYESDESINDVHIHRSKKEHVASWTGSGGSKPSPFLSTDVTLEHRKEGDVGTIILTLIQPYPVDFDKEYECVLSFNANKYNWTIELKATKVEYQPVADVVKARPGDDVQFVWIYKYPLPVIVIEFHNDLNTETDMLTWSQIYVTEVETEYTGRVRVNQKQNQGNETEITLTLLNTTMDDFNITYYGNAIAKNGYQRSSGIYLTVEEEKPKAVLETISLIEDMETPISASRLSQVSMFLICSVLLLAV